MKKFFLISACLLLAAFSFSQTINQKLQKAFQQFESDVQLKHAISSLYVIDAKTGKMVFDKNSQVGLAPASTQKIITTVTAFELLGKDFTYKTKFYHRGQVKDTVLSGTFYAIGSGDPTFGSWRYAATKNDKQFQVLAEKLKSMNIRYLDVNLTSVDSVYGELVPDGWIWQDIGNYYGAAASHLNYHENQVDFVLQSGSKIGEPVKVVEVKPFPHWVMMYYDIKSAAKGTVDNAYFYFGLADQPSFLRGTIPVNEGRFKVSSSVPNPERFFLSSMADVLEKNRVRVNRSYNSTINSKRYFDISKTTLLLEVYSPPLDSIIYWFNKKSINLYGEAFIKTLAYQKKGIASTDSGVAIVKDFWKQKGIDEDELNISDGSGLSPQNRVTTHAQVEILKYAKTRDWFPYFYNSLPEYNGMTMKSGTIKDVKGFCGYHKAKDGKEYIFSFLVNNYNGPSSGLVNKMYKVLDVLK